MACGEGGEGYWLDNDALGYPSAAWSKSSPSPAGYEREEGYSQPNATLDHCVNVLVRPTYAYFAAPVRGRRGAGPRIRGSGEGWATAL
jgi:hypothetical protein